jgi:type I restriction enzyme S subunit
MKIGWKTEPLGELCEFQRGLTYGKGDEVDVSNNVVLRATNIDLTKNLLNFDELKYINDKVVVPNSKKVKKGSLMICTASGSKSHLGKVAYIDNDYGYAFGGFMGMITPKNGLFPKYLFHLMTSDKYKDFIGELSDGVNINNLKFDDLKKFQVPLPTHLEQQRIAGILDEALEGIATAKDNAEKNFRNTHALLESHLQSVFNQRGKGWKVLTLENVGAIRTGKRDANHQVENGPYPFYTCAVGQFKSPTYSFDGASIILPGNGANVGRVFFYDGKFEAYQRTYVVNELSQSINPRFLYYCFSANWADWIANKQFGSATNYIVVGDLKAFPVPTPPLPVQDEVVEQLESFTEAIQHLARLYERKLAALDALKKSFLDQAFSGELGARAA